MHLQKYLRHEVDHLLLSLGLQRERWRMWHGLLLSLDGRQSKLFHESLPFPRPPW